MDRPGLEWVLAAFPELAIIGHGKGWWASIAGGLAQDDLHVGYPRGPVASGGAIDRLMPKFANRYGDRSSDRLQLRKPPFVVVKGRQVRLANLQEASSSR